jgi:RNA polymerase sigma-70 factor (ECF subfamily)
MPTPDPLLARLRQGDEAAFAELVARHHGQLKRLALSVLRDEAAADEVVQDAWTAAIEGLGSFEGRSSLSTWLYRIVLNRARTRRAREARSTPLSALGDADDEGAGPAVDPSNFLPDGHWQKSPARSPAAILGSAPGEDPEQSLLRGELGRALLAALEKLPSSWREVVTMRDVDGLSSEEVCNALEISESNQRVLLHRGRSRLRALVEESLGKGLAT